MGKICVHNHEIKPVTPRTHGCEECLSAGEVWEGLRMCLTCGHVGCCNNSPHRHAAKHYLSTGHPLIQTMPHEVRLIWCFVDEVSLE